MAKPTRAIFIHGNRGANADSGCFPYIAACLQRYGIEILRPNLPDSVRGRMKYWMPFIESLKPDRETLLIGHSSGTSAALRYAENNEVFGSILISTQVNDCGFELERRTGFYDDPFNWKEIKSNQQWILQIHAKDDPYISVEDTLTVHENLVSSLILTEGYGHFTQFDCDKDSIPGFEELLSKKM